MQMVVTNQKTKSIRSACWLAGSGSQGTNSATAAAPPPKSIPSRTSWTIDPLRTAPETTRRGGGLAEERADLETPATSRVRSGGKGVDRVHYPVRRNLNGTWCEHLADRGGRHSWLLGRRHRTWGADFHCRPGALDSANSG